MIDVRERELEYFVHVNRGSVSESPEGMVRVHGAIAHCPRLQKEHMHHIARRLMPMYNGDALSKQHVPKEAEILKEIWECIPVIHRRHRKVVHFKAICHGADAYAIPICMCDDDHFMSHGLQTLRQRPDVHLTPTQPREEKIRNHRDYMASPRLYRPFGG